MMRKDTFKGLDITYLRSPVLGAFFYLLTGPPNRLHIDSRVCYTEGHENGRPNA
jgi:hypothetical protein